MKILAGALLLAVNFIITVGVGAEGPSPTPTPVPCERTLKIAREIMSAARFCTMVTLNAGDAEARIVDPLEPDANFVVHIATNPGSRKVEQMRANPRVTLLYFDPVRLAYVTLVGSASLAPDRDKAALYKDDWQGFFDRERPASYSLYRFVPSRIEVVSARDGLPGDPATWRPEIVHFR